MSAREKADLPPGGLILVGTFFPALQVKTDRPRCLFPFAPDQSIPTK